MLTASPLTKISPLSAGWAPDSTRISVDLPAPLPPTRPMTSPGFRSMVTSRTAWTPPKATLMPRISTSGVCSATVTVSLLAAHEPRRRLMVSRPTATTSTTPATTFWPGEFTPMKLRPYAQRLHDEGTKHGARDRADAAGKRGPADDGRGDDVQLVAVADVERGSR